MKKSEITAWHPAVRFLFFSAMVTFSLLLRHPVCLGASLVCAALTLRRLSPAQNGRGRWKAALPLAVLTALINAAFNHRGVTILGYFPSGNPLTLESLLYGVFAGMLLCSVLLWVQCFSIVFTTEHWLFLFGTAAPSLALLLSMSLRFFEEFRRRFQVVYAAQMDFLPAEERKKRRLRTALHSFSILLNWALESAVTTADSMKSRGYGTARRTTMAQYRVARRDKALLFWLGLCLFSLSGAAAAGVFWFRCFPSLDGAAPDAAFIYLSALYVLFCLTPVLADLAHSRSKNGRRVSV